MTTEGNLNPASEPFRGNEPKTTYSVRALAEPGVMPRIMELLAKRGMTPDAWQSYRIGPDGKVLQITFQALDLDGSVANHISNCIRQIVSVETVVMSRSDATDEAIDEDEEEALSA